MTQLVFTKATKKRAKARVALDGPSGSGKTYTALIVATVLAAGGKIAVVDTERGSASLYSDEFDFDVVELNSFSPQNYVDAIEVAEKAGYAVIVIDSLSHAWEGEGGALEMVDNIAAKSQSKNSYFAWRDVTPVHRRLVDAMLQSPCHIVATMRSKTDYVIEEVVEGGRKKQIPRKIGLAPIQRAGMEYEFTILGDLDLDHKIVISKSRCKALADKVEVKPGVKFWTVFKEWLDSGEAVPTSAPSPANGGATKPAAPQPTISPEEEKYFGKPTAKAASVPAKPAVPKPAQPDTSEAQLAKSANGNGKKAEPPSDALRGAWTRLVQSATALQIDVQPWPAYISKEDASHRFETLLKITRARAEEVVKLVHEGAMPETLYEDITDMTNPQQLALYNNRLVALAGKYVAEGKVEFQDV